MKAIDPGPPVTRFDFTSGQARGSAMTLYVNCLVHRGATRLETFPLAGLSSVGVGFERDFNRLLWAGVLLFLALVLLFVSMPLATVAAAAAGEIASGASGVAVALHGLLRLVEGLARALPLIAGVLALGGVALGALGWHGTTVLTLTFPGGERSYLVRGRNTGLLDFADAVSEKLLLLRRG